MHNIMVHGNVCLLVREVSWDVHGGTRLFLTLIYEATFAGLMSRIVSTKKQCFSLTVNQQIVFLIMTFQRNEQNHKPGSWMVVEVW